MLETRTSLESLIRLFFTNFTCCEFCTEKQRCPTMLLDVSVTTDLVAYLWRHHVALSCTIVVASLKCSFLVSVSSFVFSIYFLVCLLWFVLHWLSEVKLGYIIVRSKA